jgi:hypothetical protein
VGANRHLTPVGKNPVTSQSSHTLPSSPAKLILKQFQYVIWLSGLSHLAQELPRKKG